MGILDEGKYRFRHPPDTFLRTPEGGRHPRRNRIGTLVHTVPVTSVSIPVFLF